MSGPKLIGMASSRAFRALWMLEEIGIPYQYISAMPQTEEVKKHNPLGKIPILVEEDGFVLYESGAIVTYLGDKYRGHTVGNALVPMAGTKERGRYEQTMSVLLTELDAQGLWIHRKHEAMGHVFTYIPDAVEHARKYFNKTNRMLIQQLKRNVDENTGKSFLLGSNFTAVDIVYIQCLDWSKMIGWDVKWKEDEIVMSYIKACKSRRGYRETLATVKRDPENRKTKL